MKEYMAVKDFCNETGFKLSMMRKLLACRLADEFSFRSGHGKTSPYYINVPKFKKMLERGDLKEVLEA